MTFSAKLLIRVSNLCSKRILSNVSRRSIGLRSTSDNFTGERTKYRCHMQERVNLGYDRNGKKSNSSNFKAVIATQAMFFGLFGPDQSEEEEIPEFILNIKRSILMIRNGEYDKAEQMLHLALREAQTLQNYDAITYIYDVMANLAFDTGDYKKAERLFVSVMQRLIADGTAQDDLKIIHMSLKLAKLYEHQGDTVKAEDGYKFCLQHLQDKVDKGSEDQDVILLWGMAMDWYARMLLAQSKNDEAFRYFLEAYQVCVKINGQVHEQTAVLLNDLGTISFIKGDYEGAVDYFTQATEIGKKLPDMEELGAIHVNLGNVFIKKGLYEEAQKSCHKGWKLSKKHDDRECLAEASDCLDEIKKITSS